MLDVATGIISSLMFPLHVDEIEVALESDQHAKDRTTEILQMLLNRFNELGRSHNEKNHSETPQRKE